MPHYVVTLDLHRGNQQHYDGLDGALAELDCCRPFEAVVLLCTPLTAQQVEARLHRHVDPMDAISVDRLAEQQAWSGWFRDEQAREWLHKHLGLGS